MATSTMANTTAAELESCKVVNLIVNNVNTIAIYMVITFLTLFACTLLHTILLRPLLSQPRIISDFTIGFLLTRFEFVRKGVEHHARTLNYLADFVMVCHMFVLGLQIDRNILIQPPLREGKVACGGMITTFLLGAIAFFFVNIPKTIPSTQLDFSLALILAATASPLLTRLITDLKIAKSDIGRFVVSAGVVSDMIVALLLSLGFIVFDPSLGFDFRGWEKIAYMILNILVVTLVAAELTPMLMKRVNDENPIGKTMKGSHLVLSVAYVVVLCSSSPFFAGFNSIMSAFLVGLCMPGEGRISRMIIGKVKYVLGTIFYPVFFVWVGYEAQSKGFEAGKPGPWGWLFLFFAIATVGKVVGTVVSGALLGFKWPESVAIGLLLATKGHFHVYLAVIAEKNKIISLSTCMSMIFAIILTIVYTPLVVANIIKRARKRSPTQRMALQWLDHADELHMLLCVRGPHNVPSAANLMEISRGAVEPGIMVYITDMIELTDEIAAAIVVPRGGDGAENSRLPAVTDRGVIEMREEITRGVRGFMEENGEGIKVERLMTVATTSNMHQHICISAEEVLASLIILPFHKDQQPDGTLGAGHPGFRHVNRKVLRYAPCSVGILVDRGFGSIKERAAGSSVFLNAAVLFIGGKDDREALAYAGRVAHHRGVKLTVIRFLLDAPQEDTTTTSTSRPRKPKMYTREQEEEMKLDDECFASFYDKHVARGSVAYMEKYLVNSGQTFSTLRSLEGQYGLFIVGRGGRVNSLLTVGMNDWEECPELGPIGDILTAADLSITSSVLVIQQHSLRGEIAGLDDEFTVM